MKKLRITLGIQLIFFSGWGVYLLSSRNANTPEFYLETTPVDPRDLISGTYVALSYAISEPQAGKCASMLPWYRAFHVKLESRGKTAATAQGPVPLYEAADCSSEARYDAGWAKATVEPGPAGTRAAKYGIERFYLNENDPRKDARSGAVLAKVKIDNRRQLVLLDLVAKVQP
ncbi:MAG: hypothetical protein A2234_05830 [Elusimicrobia bacterium RIFOXYA2_FULL_58_8]|nr:MAG: hypothetical protein A2234_05830 [Elusimicrobia bacterium RIFOXYA2_FULL_58_8]OGS13942.1 MAG: hypothetical protein A2285_02655 [Elusimicrobia bacterium RIFOXYA12_FULL_57_11]